MQVAYAEDLRLFLSEHLAKITLITFEQLVFPDIEQEVVVFIGEKGSVEKGIRIIEMSDLSDFDKLDLQQNGFQKMQHVKEKWTRYFTTAKEMELIQTIRADNEDWKKNKTSGKSARLVNFPDIPIEDYPEQHKAYIALGEASGENDGYKCSIRDRWYIVPSVWVPDAFFLRRNNLYPKFVLNRCNAVSTDTMHRMKFNSDVKPENILLAYYNSISFAFTEICGRSYGGGVLEILPGEMGNIMLPKLDDIDEETCRSLLKRIDAIVREDDDIEKALDIVDKEILVDALGIEAEWCEKCRAIWKKMQRRRLGRG